MNFCALLVGGSAGDWEGRTVDSAIDDASVGGPAIVSLAIGGVERPDVNEGVTTDEDGASV